MSTFEHLTILEAGRAEKKLLAGSLAISGVFKYAGKIEKDTTCVIIRNYLN